ncbi:hypothetical protein [Luteimicrobium subarcticum]|uniref:Uncharacterized protein n=1 Tax=Luteimicrobium subarcticum TaxID=620910 RepID=A0A2M8WW04_9MICO|nr:hypothetical protein [Luteimicrobium subarcticum]PJI95097.1 hypothetical protein CLV34_0950 [Luteimicrobium subarcticum]
MTVTTRSVVTACIATLVAGAAYFGTMALTGAVVVLVVGVALGWPALLHLRAPGTSGFVVALVGLGAVGVVTVTDGEPVLRNLPVVVAMGLLLAFVNELARHPRDALVENVSGVVSGIVVAVGCSGWLAAGMSDEGAQLVVACAAALAVAAVVCAMPLRGWANAVVTTGLAVATGAGIGAALPKLLIPAGAWAGLVAGVLVAAVYALLGHLPTARGRLASLSAATLPVAVGGILIFVVGRLVVT